MEQQIEIEEARPGYGAGQSPVPRLAPAILLKRNECKLDASKTQPYILPEQVDFVGFSISDHFIGLAKVCSRACLMLNLVGSGLRVDVDVGVEFARKAFWSRECFELERGTCSLAWFSLA